MGNRMVEKHINDQYRYQDQEKREGEVYLQITKIDQRKQDICPVPFSNTFNKDISHNTDQEGKEHIK
jgi:hypothetical protein